MERSTDSQRQRRPLRGPSSPRDVESGAPVSPPNALASPHPLGPPGSARRRRPRARLTRALLLAALYALALVLYLSRGLPSPSASLSRWWRGRSKSGNNSGKRVQAVRFRDGDAVYADDFDAVLDGAPPDPDDGLLEDDEEDAMGPVDLVRAVRGRGEDGAPLSPREILAQLAKVGPRARPGLTETPRPTVDAETMREAVEHARQVKMLPPVQPQDAPRRFRCVGWRATSGCSPFGPRDPANDQPCTHVVPAGQAGYCEVQDKDSGERFRVMHVHCASLVPAARFRCFEAWDFANFPVQARDATRVQLADTSGRGLMTLPTDVDTQGIVMVVYPKLIPSAYATVRALRDLGCVLPVEIWFRQDEVAKAPKQQRALLRLHADFGPVTLRAIDDQHRRAVGFATKIHAISHSAFAQLLFLDADNAPVRDPTFLFASREFRETGALFWPDFWHPGHTIFNVHATSLVWELLGLRSVNMFEQESGQLLVDRRRHAEPLALVNFYTFHRPNHLERLQLVWGDKDLFRLAWLKARASFHMVQWPPALAGLLVNGTDFCGLTMVQHDPQGRVLFLHRNSRKLLGVKHERPASNERERQRAERERKRREVLARRGIVVEEQEHKEDEDSHVKDEDEEDVDLPEAADGLPDPVIWTHLLSFRSNASRASDYVVDIYKLPPFLPDWQSCYGRQKPLESPHFELQSIQDLPFAGLELTLRQYAREAAAMAETG